MSERSIVLTGFMAAGKTAVGRRLAETLGRELVDMDAVIEEREGQSVREVFAQRGERYFRALEADLCRELAQRQGLVIATGGGTLVDPENRARFAGAFTVCLDVDAETVLRRLGDVRERPMLAGGNHLAGRVEELLAARRAAYQEIAVHVDTAGLSVEEVAERIASLYRRDQAEGLKPTLCVAAPLGAYPIYIGNGLLSQVGPTLAGLASFSRRCAVVTNPTVGGLYAGRVVESLRAAGFEPSVLEVPDGERYKTLASASGLYDRLVERRLDRRSPVLALGGGVIGDLAGFVAATFLRGVPFVQLPTTLLAVVDSSVGGKVAVDHPGGKNLIGAIKQPAAVFADTATLATLPAAQWRCGLAETVKHAVIGDANLFARLEAGLPETAEWLEASVRVKAEIVARDPFEEGERLKLNLGHTFGHALETLSGYELSHGDAVSVGLVCAARLAVRLGLCGQEAARRLEALLRELGLPTRIAGRHATDAVLNAMQADKKRLDGRLRFVLPRGLEDVVVVSDVARDDVAAVIEETRSEG